MNLLQVSIILDFAFKRLSRKKMIKCFLSIVFLFGALIAEEKTFIREYTYRASDYDSKVKSRENALAQVKLLLLEEIAVFIKSEFKTENNSSNINNNFNIEEFDSHKISSITAGITQTKILDEKWTGEVYWIKAQITLDPEDVKEKINEAALNLNQKASSDFQTTINLSDEETADGIYKYVSFYSGAGFGSLDKFYAESAFSNPDDESQTLWTANVLDVTTRNTLPQIGLKIGGWKSGYGGELEMSYLGHKIPDQIVYYDSNGQIFIPPTDDFPEGYYYTIEPQDSVDLPDGFLTFNSFSVGGSGYFTFSLSKHLYLSNGFGVSLSMNNVSSDFSGPGRYAAKNVMVDFGYDLKEEQSLNTNHFGWGYFLPLGIKYIFKKDYYITSEIRFSRKYISFVASEGYLKELDETILQSFQFNIGYGKFIK